MSRPASSWGAGRIITLITAGFLSILVQTVLLRELMAVAHGTEVTMGFGLASWLFGGAAGSLTVPRLFPRNPGDRGLAACFILMAAISLPCLAFLRGFGPAAGYLPGQGVSLGHMALMALVPMTAEGFIFGAMYVFGVRFLEEGGGVFPAGTAYWAEAAGCLAGGAAFTFYLAFRLTGAGAVTAASILALTGSAMTVRHTGARMLLTCATIAAMIPALAAAPLLERSTQAWAYPGYRIESSVSSPYGQTIAAERRGEREVFHNGYPVLHLPVLPTLWGEELAALGMVHAGSLGSVLLIGGAEQVPLFSRLGGGRIVLAEQDPVLLKAMEGPCPEDAGAFLQGENLELTATDGRLLVEKAKRHFDLIIVSVPPPSSISQNRYYTEEFFRAARNALRDGGSVALSLPGSQARMDRRKERLSLSVFSALAAAMPYAAFFPGETNILVGVKGRGPSDTSLLRRFRELAPSFGVLSSGHLKSRLHERRMDNFRQESLAGQVGRNRDLRPSALAASLMLWQSVFSPGWARAYEALARFLPLLWVLMAAGLLWPRMRHGGAAFTAGSASMGIQAICLWGVQVRSGALFQWLGLGNALFMAGVAIGAWACSAWARTRAVRIVQWEAVFTLWTLAFLAGQAFISMPGWAYLACSAVTGAILGLEFPALVKGRAGERGVAEAEAAGPVYAWDMAGGMFTAMLIGVLVIPTWGLAPAAAVAAGLKATSLRWWLRG